MLTDLDYELLSAYIDGALTESERTAFELRLQADPELRGELDELRATVTLLNNLLPLKAPRDFILDTRRIYRSYFFTSATFSALSAAAAILLFAIGAYLFTGNKTPLPANSSLQVGQVASVPTTSGTVLDKAAATTVTEQSLNEVQVTTNTPLNSPIVPPNGAASNDGIMQMTASPQPSSLPDQSPFFQADAALATDVTGGGDNALSSSAAAAPSDMQQRTHEATQTVTNDQYPAPMTSSGTTGGAPAPSQAQETDATEAEANTSMAFAATQAPTAMALNTVTALPTASPVPSATFTPTFTLTLSATMTNTIQPTETAMPQPTTAPLVFQPNNYPGDMTSLVLVVIGVIFLLIAVATTVIRRRNRS